MAEQQDDNTDEAFGVTDKLLTGVLDAVKARDTASMDALLDPLHPADVAHLLEQIDGKYRPDVLSLWSGGLEGDVLSELDESLREEVIEQLEPAELAEAVRDLESDDVVDLVEYLDEEQQEAVLDALDAGDRVVVEQALSYPEESAGRHMQSELVRAPEHWTVGEAIDYLRSDVVLPDQFYHIILIDPRLKAVGYVTLGRILSHPRDTPLKDLTEDTFRTFHVAQDVEEVAQAINHYHLITAPVVDDDDRIVGVITIDDAMMFLEEEAEEDILRLAGVGEGRLSDKVIETTKRRFPWLAVNLVTAILASLVIALFEETIAGLVALAVLMPIVASMGGNAGTQSLTVAVRALATRDLTTANLWRVIRREVLVGLINGLIFAVVMGAVGIVWFGSPMLGVVIAVAMVINLVVAGLAGTVIPVALEKMGVDPALASGAFVTTVTDVVGFFAFLGLAALWLL
ncbi:MULTISPECIES: magnesium transporter [unclassified Cognatiyoonia]|uniref:magnesium transporter n=1 Tax=unclassified Cognatiyoonia TaxID=2635977 RepID=UPI002A12A792|nr:MULTISPECIES: magnesium transporter [unclassified Cognatiyoonia]MDX8347586.1 magnesium transporter [Cognatiyoonia sp. IB215446]MDX8353759.1 magnesium transporter [Cognatiyoonia sp. IB215182]